MEDEERVGGSHVLEQTIEVGAFGVDRQRDDRPAHHLGRADQTQRVLLVQTVDGLVHNCILHPPKDIDAKSLTQELVRMFDQRLRG